VICFILCQQRKANITAKRNAREIAGQTKTLHSVGCRRHNCWQGQKKSDIANEDFHQLWHEEHYSWLLLLYDSSRTSGCCSAD